MSYPKVKLRSAMALVSLLAGCPVWADQAFVPYPSLAAARGEHGSAAAALVIDSAGEIARCQITRSSGSAELDKATCPLVARDHYVAAGSADARRVDVKVVHWRLPGLALTAADLPIDRGDTYVIYDPNRTPAAHGEYHPVILTALRAPLPQPFQPGFEAVNLIAEIVVSGTGRAKSCRAAQSTGYSELDDAICKEILGTATFEVDRGAKGKIIEPAGKTLPAIVLLSIDYVIAGTGKSALARRNAGKFAGSTPIQPWGWATDDDYPTEAIRANLQGVAAVEVGVGAGRAIFCNVVSSSGAKVLDEKTCQLAMKRGIFAQAHDIDGKPVLGVASYRFRWLLPDGQHTKRSEIRLHDIEMSLAALPTGLTTSVFELRYLADENGKVIGCEAERSSGASMLDVAACKYTSEEGFAVIRDSRGKGLRHVQIRSIGITLSQ